MCGRSSTCRACLRRPHGPNRCPSRSTSATPPKKLAVQEEARKKQEAKDKLPETVAALQAALEDADALNVDQEYRLTLLELGITDADTETTT